MVVPACRGGPGPDEVRRREPLLFLLYSGAGLDVGEQGCHVGLGADGYGELLAAAVTTLTAAVRLTWTVVGPDGATHTGLCDWAEFVTLALAGATANVGSIDAVSSGRPGSWEANVSGPC